jgi:type IV pilus assembly protein PilE
MNAGSSGRRDAQSNERRVRGFTLIDLMVAVAIVAILAAIAVPSYQAYVTRAKRASARTVLLETAQVMERQYTQSGCYNYMTPAACQAQTGAAFSLPTTTAPRDTRAAYAISVVYAGGGQAYTLFARPCGDSGAGCPTGSETFTDAGCGAFSLDSTGVRGALVTFSGPTATIDSTAATLGQCWQR